MILFFFLHRPRKNIQDKNNNYTKKDIEKETGVLKTPVLSNYTLIIKTTYIICLHY